MVFSVQSDVLDIIPHHVVDPVAPSPLRLRLARGGRDALLSVALNGAAVWALIGAGFPLRSDKAPEVISVELVSHVPDPSGENASGGRAAGGARQETGAATVANGTDHPPGPPVTPRQDSTDERQVARSPNSPAASQPAPPDPPAEPQTQEPPTSSAAAEPSQTPPPVPPPTSPPPPEHPDADPRPRLVEAPSAPPAVQPEAQIRAGAGSSEAPRAASVASAPPTPAPVEARTPAQRPVDSVPDAEDVVAPPSPPQEAPKPLTEDQRREAANTATLAAMLPFGGGIGGNPFVAQSLVAGTGTSTAYRGQVYANFNKAQDIIADAKARHLRGQAVVAFTIDDRGNLASLGIAVSSKNPEVDQAALELIRRAAPFPPPPPGAQRSFAPAIGLGLEE